MPDTEVHTSNGGPARSSLELPGLEKVDRDTSLDNMENITIRAIALHLHLMDITVSQQALDQLFELFTLHIDQMLSDLQKITQTQRRRKASPKDLRFLLRDFHISTGELEEEFLKTRSLPKDIFDKKRLFEQEALKLTSGSNNDLELYPHNPSLVFFAHDEDIIRLIPPSHKKSDAILSWLPEFPPDHTYRRTPNYTQRITDQALVRTKLAEESTLGEQALEHLIDGENEESVMPILQPVEDGDIIEDENTTQHMKVVPLSLDESQLTIPAPERPLDIVQYAKERMDFMKAKQLRKMKKQKGSRYDQCVLSVVSNNSPYGDSYDDFISSDQFIELQYLQTMSTFKSLRERKKKREEERKVLKKERMKRREELAEKSGVDFNDFDDFGNFDDFENFGDDDVEKICDHEPVVEPRVQEQLSIQQDVTISEEQEPSTTAVEDQTPSSTLHNKVIDTTIEDTVTTATLPPPPPQGQDIQEMSSDEDDTMFHDVI
jgi:transcription initiation factor TFIID subunit 8